MLVRGVVGHDVDDQADAREVQRRHQLVELLERADARVHIPVVSDVVPAVGQRGRVERAQPYRVDAQRLQIWDARDDAAQVAQPVAVGIGEGARIDLVHDGLTPPVWVLG